MMERDERVFTLSEYGDREEIITFVKAMILGEGLGEMGGTLVFQLSESPEQGDIGKIGFGVSNATAAKMPETADVQYEILDEAGLLLVVTYSLSNQDI